MKTLERQTEIGRGFMKINQQSKWHLLEREYKFIKQATYMISFMNFQIMDMSIVILTMDMQYQKINYYFINKKYSYTNFFIQKYKQVFNFIPY
ncbi:unnamed protein product [Paramecium octaurelia]|uniref:Uncharacterized protein n=1 Tax=Paramecium octaurelia TaxID=43137 RepID=A0A8S1XB90_PAROT|nr:unnamed protein product [Paramecium octaurelia]